MKKIKNENQYAGGKRNFEDNRKSHPDYTRDGLKGRDLFRNVTEQDDNEEQETNQPINLNRNKIDSVQAEMHIRSWGSIERKTVNRNNGRKNSERA